MHAQALSLFCQNPSPPPRTHQLVRVQVRLLPALKLELKARLLNEARDHVAHACGTELWDLLQPGPLRVAPPPLAKTPLSRPFPLSSLHSANQLSKPIHLAEEDLP